MNRRVRYKTLWLVSARDGSARKQLFSQKTLLLGPNGTGKSRIIKNLYWVFGCKTRKRDAGMWDPDTVAALEFTYCSFLQRTWARGRRHSARSLDSN